MSLSLTALPPEIVSCVVANIESKLSLCNLARCSHQFYLHTIPHLYYHIKIQEAVRQREQQNGQLRDLASLLIRRPDLAMLVRHFTLHAVLPSSPRIGPFKKSEEHVRPGFVEVDQAFKTAISIFSESKTEEHNWLRQLSHTHRGHRDLILALLLAALPKVEELVLNLETQFDTPCLERMIRRAAHRERPFDIQPSFRALKIYQHTHSIGYAQTTGCMDSLLRLPLIQKISGSFRNQTKRDHALKKTIVIDKALAELDSSSSPLASLDLSACVMTPIDLGHMLRVPKALKTMFYRLLPYTCVTLTDICHALGPQKNCLESLGFVYDNKYYQIDDVEYRREAFGPMTSFVGFKSLKVFKTPVFSLEKTENGTERHKLINIFPPSLETLHLTHFQACSESILEALEHLIAQKSPQHIPSLKTIILEGPKIIYPSLAKPMWWTGTPNTTMGNLSRVAAAQGVSIDTIEGWIDEER